MNKTKYNFFEQIYMAITRPMQYFRLTKIGGGRLTGFVFLFVFITSLFFIIPFTYSMVGPNGFTSYLHDNIPAFQFSDGEFHMEKRFEEKEDMNYILVDTSIEKFTTDDVNDLYDQVILVSKTNMITYQYGREQIFDFSKMGKLSFDNGILKLLVPFIYLCLFVIAIFYYLFKVAGYFLTALLFSLVGLIVALATGSKIKYPLIFRTAIYGKVTASIISAIFTTLFMITPLNLPKLTVTGITILITCAYVVYGTLSHNSDEAHAETTPTPPTDNFMSGY